MKNLNLFVRRIRNDANETEINNKFNQPAKNGC